MKNTNSRRKVCFLVGNLNYGGGTERVTSLIANALSRADYDVCILSLSEGKKPFFTINTGIQIDSLFSTNGSFKVRFVQTIFKIRRFLIRNHIDTLIVVDSISCLFTIPACSFLKIKHICWEHFNFINNNGTILRDIARKMAGKYCDIVVTLTNRDKEIWLARLPDIRAQVISIPNPCPFKNISHIPSLEFKHVLAIGRFVPVKGFDLLINTWAQVCEKKKDWMLLIVGGGEEELKLKAQVQHLHIEKNVRFISFTPDVARYYKQSSLYCMSSRYEGFPMVLLEAQAFGLPVVSFNCDTGPSEIIENEKNGLLVPVLDTKKLAVSLLDMMDLPSEKYNIFVQRSFEKSREFSIEKVLSEWLSII